jgi:ribosomal protein S18 acetylase RimI-like enzyme
MLNIHIRTATLEDISFLTDVVIQATRAQGRLEEDFNEAEYRAGFEDWTRETIMGVEPGCILSVIENDGSPIGRLRVVRSTDKIILAGIQILPEYQNKRIGSQLIEQLKHEADEKSIPLIISVEKDNPNAQRLYESMGCTVVGEDEREYHLEYRPK